MYKVAEHENTPVKYLAIVTVQLLCKCTSVTDNTQCVESIVIVDPDYFYMSVLTPGQLDTVHYG